MDKKDKNIGDVVVYEGRNGKVVGLNGNRCIVKFPKHRDMFSMTECIEKVMEIPQDKLKITVSIKDHFYLIMNEKTKEVKTFCSIEEFTNNVNLNKVKDYQMFEINRLPAPEITFGRNLAGRSTIFGF